MAKNPIYRSCSKCEAAAQEPCRDPVTGVFLSGFHDERSREVKKAWTVKSLQSPLARRLLAVQ